MTPFIFGFFALDWKEKIRAWFTTFMDRPYNYMTKNVLIRSFHDIRELLQCFAKHPYSFTSCNTTLYTSRPSFARFLGICTLTDWLVCTN